MVLSEAASFLRIAAADLDTARASSDPAIFREGAWGFWLQQAVEKALKAWLLNFGVVPPTTARCQRRRRPPTSSSPSHEQTNGQGVWSLSYL